MVVIAPPPPPVSPAPVHVTLPSRTELLRIFNPLRYGGGAATFRYNGPRSRFDHHDPALPPRHDPAHGVIYLGHTLSCCVAEFFGSTGHIVPADLFLGRVRLDENMHLLDLRGNGALSAGTVAALTKTVDRDLSQQWSRHFYNHHAGYGLVDGLIWYGAHNDEDCIMLYERCATNIVAVDAIRLDDSRVLPLLYEAAEKLHLIM